MDNRKINALRKDLGVIFRFAGIHLGVILRFAGIRLLPAFHEDRPFAERAQFPFLSVRDIPDGERLALG